MRDKSCDTCAYKEEFSEDGNGNRLVKCELNDYQMFFPFAEECIHWERGRDDDE